MPKELIVSVNGREKKIAIIENERVTEFYIERGEDNQGIVGNIYKGRVMRVLPGMQSAFVDIGLERDAFLYVSDFFDEEEEFERIVMDKSKKGDAATAERAAKEQIEQARVEREHKIEITQERAEPFRDAEEPSLPAVIDVAELVVEPLKATAPIEEPEAQRDAESAGRRRNRRGRRRGKGPDEPRESGSSAPIIDVEYSVTGSDEEAEDEEIATPFAVALDSFQRVVDEDELAAEDGAMFKDARVQEKIFDQIHAVEFDLGDLPSTQVGSILPREAKSNDAFQRIDDSDVALEGAPATRVQEAVAAHVEAFVDDLVNESSSARNFQRVSDDEQAEAVTPVTEVPVHSEKPGKRSRSRNNRKETAAQSADAAQAEAPPTETSESPSEETPVKRSARGKSAKEATRKGASKKGAASKARSRKSSAPSDQADEAGESENLTAANDESPTGEALAESQQDDIEASVTTGREHAEFATRRGGRRRRRPGKQDGPNGEQDRANGKDDEVPASIEEQEPVPTPVAAPVAVAPAIAPPASAPKERQHGGDSRGPRGQRSGGGGGGGSAQRRDRPQPTITDLLREGQEILVQIAKEPIAKKGARITSHIALPGRFLVYMPTVEHVGVSRKIESDSERQRLRRLIQSIRAEEDVPSGGFIVRTAGTGISEEDLRDDARYLVRTWLDIRRNAEKTKAPAVVHQDLDLVERLLRDQLSDDFTAIRVDSEEEYQRIVEFVDRIQPRMVKRVKLHTREEPILEAYGVQAEIDKAIKPRVWLRSGGYLVINQTEALVAIDVNTGKFVGRGGTRLEDTITRTNLEAVEEIVRQIRLRDLGGIIVLDLIDMEDRRNRNRVMQALQEALQYDKSPTKVLSFNDFGLVIMTRKRVKQSLERTLCSPCPYCTGAGLVKSPQTVCYEILEEARRLGKGMGDDGIKQTTLRVNPEVGRALRSTEKDVLSEIEDYLGPVDLTSDQHVHQEQFDFAFI
jgi:ribonuclease G